MKNFFITLLAKLGIQIGQPSETDPSRKLFREKYVNTLLDSQRIQKDMERIFFTIRDQGVSVDVHVALTVYNQELHKASKNYTVTFSEDEAALLFFRIKQQAALDIKDHPEISFINQDNIL